jgi:hypothetical protein
MDARFARRWALGRFCVCALLVGIFDVGLAVRPASAQRARVMFGYGDEIMRLGQIANARVAAQLKERFGKERLYPPAVGYKYRQLIVGAPLWTWDGEYCVFSGERYVIVPRAEAAELLGLPEQRLRAPFFYRFPLGLVGGAFVLLVGVPGAYVVHRVRERERQREEAHAASFIGAELPPAKPVRTFLSE